MKLTGLYTFLERNPRLSILILPLCINFVKKEGHFLETFLVILLVFLLDFLFQKINNGLKFIFYFLIFITIYTLEFYYDTQFILHDNTRVVYFLIGFSLFFFPVIGIFFYFKRYNVLNSFLLIFSITILATFSYFDSENKSKEILKELKYSSSQKNYFVEKDTTPLILIILDELISYDELYRITKDSTLSYKFSDKLSQLGYIPNNRILTESQRSIYSMSSLFNFNLHENSKGLDSLEKLNGVENLNQLKFQQLIKESLLINKLNSKNIKSISYGLTEFGDNNQFSNIWKMHKNDSFSFHYTTMMLLSKTLFSKWFFGMVPRDFKINKFRSDVFNKLLSENFKPNTFYYYHFLAPHEPFTWAKEYIKVDTSEDPEKYFQDYLNYLNFIEIKIYEVVKDNKFKNCRIIISGDHGLRNSKGNANYTSAFFYGFDNANIEKVQDLGYLINESY